MFKKYFLERLKEYSEELDSRPNSRSFNFYKRAHATLASESEEFNHPEELLRLKNFGAKTCKRLEIDLKEHCLANGLPFPESSRKYSSQSPEDTPEGRAEGSSTPKRQTKRTNTKKQYVPRYRSGGYALLIALYQNRTLQGVAKKALCELAQPFADQPFINVQGRQLAYSAWHSMATLIKHDLVYATSSKNPLYFITEAGQQIARRLKQVAEELKDTPERVSQNCLSTPSQSPTRSSTEMVSDCSPSKLNRTPEQAYATTVWKAGTYDIVLALDNREVASKKDRDFFVNKLTEKDVPVVVRALPVGDIIWLGISKSTKEEVVLDTIVERKRLDDLVSSIKDGRFLEQKRRLHSSLLPNIIYLIEGNSNYHAGPFLKAVKTAMSQSAVQDGFFLKMTQSSDDTVNYLKDLSSRLEVKFSTTDLQVHHPRIDNDSSYKIAIEGARKLLPESNALAISMQAFEVAMSKSSLMTIRDIFTRMLMTTKGVTFDRALAIQKIFPTPSHLIKGYQGKSTVESRKHLLYTDLDSNLSRQKISKLLSEKVYSNWGEP